MQVQKRKILTKTKLRKTVSGIKVKLAYQKNSFEDEEILAGKIEGNIDGLFYQITREDKGFDSGRKALTPRISEDLPLLKNSYNFFRLLILDGQNNIVETDVELIGIAHNKYGSEQVIAHDICLEVDANPELEITQTKLKLAFQKNTIIPQKKVFYETMNKTIIKGSEDKIVINVVEGSQYNLPEANQTIGYLEISGKKMSRDILRNTEIEITLEMSESRDLKATVYIPMSDQQFTEVFNPSQRHLPVSKLQDEVEILSEKIDTEISEAVQREDFETAEILTNLKKRVDILTENSNKLTSDDSTDDKFKLENKKIEIAQEIDNATRDKRIALLKIKYNEDKEWCKKIVDENGNDHDHKIFNDIVGREQSFLNSITPVKIMEAIDELVELGAVILWRTPLFLENRFKRLIEKPQLF